MASHSSTLAWKIPWTEEPGGLQSMGSRRVWATSLSLFCIGEGNGNPLQCSCLENPRDGGAWWAAVYGVAESRRGLKRLSSSSSRASLLAQLVKNPPARRETWVQSLGEGTASHSSTVAWRIHVQSTGSQRVAHDWETFSRRLHKAHWGLPRWR